MPADAASSNTALEQLAGGLARPLLSLREALLELLAPSRSRTRFRRRRHPVRYAPRKSQQTARRRVVSWSRGRTHNWPSATAATTLPRVVLVGCPNVGKSSLFNALVRRAAALVSNEPGTTRDYLTATLDLDGVACQLIDTAGVETDDESDCGIRQVPTSWPARNGASADCDCCASIRRVRSTPWERASWRRTTRSSDLSLLTKCDPERVWSKSDLPCEAIETSARNGLGLGRTRQALRQAVVELARSESAAHLTAERCADSLRRAAGSLARAAELNRGGRGEELIGSELRVALTELSRWWAPFTPTTFWTASSAAFASANRRWDKTSGTLAISADVLSPGRGQNRIAALRVIPVVQDYRPRGESPA